MEQREYWDSVAETKEFTTPFQRDLFMRYAPRESRVLDVGCGYGRTLAELHTLGYRNLRGVDFSEKLIARARNENPTIDFQVAPCDELPYSENQFDAVILFAVLTCLISDAQQKRVIAEIRRTLAPGGVLYVNDFLLNDDARNLDRYQRYASRYGYGAFELPEGAILRHHRYEYICELLEPFETLEMERQTFRTMNGHTSKGFYYFGRKNLAREKE